MCCAFFIFVHQKNKIMKIGVLAEEKALDDKRVPLTPKQCKRLLDIYPKLEPHKAWTGALGVLKKFRRNGIATALKIKAIEKLLQKGVTEVRTDNELNNPMYKINVALGFKPVPFSLEYSKEI